MSSTSAIVWAQPNQAPMLSDALARAGVSIVGAGCADPTRGSETAKSLSCEHFDDLRRVLNAAKPDLVLLADPGGFGDKDLENDMVALQHAHAHEVCVATLEPIPAEATVITGTSWTDALQSGAFAQFVRLVPMVRRSRLIDELMAALESFGPIRSMSMSLLSPSIYGSLGARLFDAMDLFRTLMGIPEIIDAAYTGTSSGSALHQLPGQSLRNLHGVITAHMRLPDGRAGIVQISDQTGRTSLSMNILGSDGHISVHDLGFTRYDRSGTVIDSCEVQVDSEIDPSARRLTEQLIQLCSGVAPSRSPVDHASVLAMGHTALLSARTGQGETPETIRRLLLEV